MVKQNKEKSERLYRYQKIALIVAILLVVALLIMNTFSWLVNATQNSDFLFSIGDVDYKITSTKDDVFYNLTELSMDAGEEEKVFDGNPVNATSYDMNVTLASGSDTDYLMPKYSILKINIVFYDENRNDITSNCTDVVTFSSSNANNITVSSFGTMYAKGFLDSTATITATFYHLDSDGNTTEYSTAQSFSVKIIESDETVYGYLPAGAEIMRNPLQINNLSNVSTKLRSKVTREYTGYDQETSNERITCKIADLSLTSNIKFSVSEEEAPIIMSFKENEGVPEWHSVPVFNTDNVLYFSLSGYDWVIDELSFKNETEKTNVLNWINNPTGNCPIESIMIDKAYTYICYSSTQITVASSQNNYGDTIPKASTSNGDIYTVINQINITNSYTAFSTKKFLTLHILIEARQSSFFTKSDWFDVSCYTLSN